jgi:hypothetical protein
LFLRPRFLTLRFLPPLFLAIGIRTAEFRGPQ